MKRLISAALAALIPIMCPAGQTLDWALRPAFGLTYPWDLQISSRVGDKCADDVTFSWGASSSPAIAMVNSRGSQARRCGGSGYIGSIESHLPAEPFQARWHDWLGVEHSASVDIAQVMGGTEVYGGGLEILINNDRLEVWFSAPDKSHSKINATFWPKKHAELVYSTDPTLASSVWTFSLDTAGLDRSKKETLKNFWFKWGDTPLSDLNKAGSQKRPMNYSFAPTTVYEPLPDAPLELHWEVPAGVQRDFSIPVAQLMAGKKLGGGRLSITAYPEHVELWFEENGALFNSKKNQKRLIYSSAS